MNVMNNTENDRISVLLPLFSAVAAAAPFFLYTPLSLYLGNAEEFPFTLYNFGWILLFLFLSAVGILFCIGVLLRKKRTLEIVWCVFLFALGLLFYLQGNFLFEDTGVFNGLPYDASAHREHIVFDTAVWGLVILISIVAALRFRERMAEPVTVFSGLFSGFILLSAVILLLGAKSEYLKPRTTFVSTKGLYEVSEEKNLIVLVPDMFDKTYMDSILAESPELTADLEGFVYYPETKGCFSSTKESLPYFLSQEALFEKLSENGYSLGIYTDGRFLPDTLKEETVNCVDGEVGISDYPALVRLLCRLSACSCAPEILREYVWLDGTEFESLCTVKDSPETLYSNSNTGFYYNMKETGIVLSETPCFRMIHLYGAHYPYVTDEYLNPITPSYTDGNAVGAAKASLRIMTAYLNRLKDAGAYDSSLIVIMADHGYTAPGLQTDPVMLIKQPGAAGAFSVSEETVPQEKIAELLLPMIP